MSVEYRAHHACVATHELISPSQRVLSISAVTPRLTAPQALSRSSGQELPSRWLHIAPSQHLMTVVFLAPPTDYGLEKTQTRAIFEQRALR